MTRLHLGVLGAGAIGGFIALHAASAGAQVTLVGRAPLAWPKEQLSARRRDGRVLRAPPELTLTADAAALAAADLVVVTVKSRDSAAAGEVLAASLPPRTPVISLQNGLGNLHRLGRSLGPRVIAGVVSFNVVREGGRLEQATTGPIFTGSGDPPQAPLLRRLAACLAAADLPLELREDIADVAAGKLLLNLSNGVGAACGLSIAETLRSRDARWCFARCVREGLPILRRAGYRPIAVIGLPPGLLAVALTLPDAIVLRIARRLIDVDPAARSSTLQDLIDGRRTEIGELNGAIADLAATHGLRAPANHTVAATIRELETRPPPHGFPTPAELRQRITAASAA